MLTKREMLELKYGGGKSAKSSGNSKSSTESASESKSASASASHKERSAGSQLARIKGQVAGIEALALNETSFHDQAPLLLSGG